MIQVWDREAERRPIAKLPTTGSSFAQLLPASKPGEGIEWWRAGAVRLSLSHGPAKLGRCEASG